MSVLSDFRARYLVRFWSPIPALVALGVASAYYFAITGTFWAVTGEFTRWGGHVLAWFGFQPQEWSYFKLIGLQGTPLDRIDFEPRQAAALSGWPFALEDLKDLPREQRPFRRRITVRRSTLPARASANRARARSL